MQCPFLSFCDFLEKEASATICLPFLIDQTEDAELPAFGRKSAPLLVQVLDSRRALRGDNNRLYDERMQLDALRRRYLLALGLPLLGGACATPGTPPSDSAAKVQGHSSEKSAEAATPVRDTAVGSDGATSPSEKGPEPVRAIVPQLATTTDAKPFSPCEPDHIREQLCGQGVHPGPESCPATGEHLTAFGRNVIVSGINIHARDGSLRIFAFDPAATSAYRGEILRSRPEVDVSRDCCYSHCQPLTVAASAVKQIPIGMTEGSYCIPIPEGGTKFPAAHSRHCPAAIEAVGAMRPYLPARVPGQCCYSFPHPIMLPHPRGRAARVGGVPHVAEVSSEQGWRTTQTAPDVSHLDAKLRTRLSARWLKDAQLEHASVAAFARTSLELMAFGAPPELLIEAHQAALDEISHARVTFALASAYAGESLGPQAFPEVRGMAPAADWATWARETIEDGCLGETIAAAEAHEAAQCAEDPVVRAALLGIAEDEVRHAELAWKILRFALQAGGAEVAAVVRTARAALATKKETALLDTDEDLDTHGFLGARSSARLRSAVVDAVVLPCLDGLLLGQC